MQISFLTLQRLIWATSLVVAIGLFPQQGQAEPPKPDKAIPAKPEQVTSSKPGQPAPAKPEPAPPTTPEKGTPSKPGQPAPAKPEDTSPKLSLGEDPTIRIPVGSTGGEVQVMMKAENLTDALVAGATNPVLKDWGGAGSLATTKVEFKNPQEIGAGTTNRAWLLTATISNLPFNSSQKRSAHLSFGKVEKLIEYTLTNLSPAAFSWSVAAPGVPWLVWFGYSETQRTFPVVVTTGDYPASDLRLAQAILRDGSGALQIVLEDIELCESATALSSSCGHFNINARTNRTFYVRLKDKDWQSIWQDGKYAGSLSFAVNERPELQTVNVTLQASSFAAKGIGAFLIFIGILSAWMTGVWARARLLRLEAQRPVLLLRDSVKTLIEEVNHAPEIPDVSLEDTKTALTKIREALETEVLDSLNLLPPKLPDPRGGSADTSARLKDYLTKETELVGCLTLVICEGMRRLWREWKPPQPDLIKVAIQTALKSLDAVARKVGGGEITTLQDAKQEVKRVVDTFNTARGFAPPRPEGIEEPSVLQVNWQIARLFELQWLVWGIITFIVGVAVLIVRDPGFGTMLDLVFCLLWGFGLPTGIDRLQNLGPGDIATTMNINFPPTKKNS
jgi:hypothetical protein